MRSRWVPVLGWVECALAFVFLLVSAVGLVYDNAEVRVFLWDALTFVVLLFMVRRPLPGFALLIAAAFGGLLVDPDGIGMSHYIAACGVVLAVRLGRMPLAVVGTATLGGALFYAMLRRAEDAPILAVVGAVLFYLLVWALGLGTRSVAAAEAARVEARHRKRQLEVATDLHDFVAGNLSALVMAAEALPQDNPAVVELAERARRANASLRAITSVLREEDGTEERIPAVGAEEALARGLETVGSRGGQPQVAPGTKTALVGLPKAVDHAVGRILSEADTSAQIELDSGKRVKAKTAYVLLRFDKPAPAELMAQAQAEAATIDLDLAWEFASDGEFSFAEMARDYFSENATLVQQAAALLALQDAPHYFRRAGKGHFKRGHQQATVGTVVIGQEMAIGVQALDHRKEGLEVFGVINIRRLAAELAVDLSENRGAHPVLPTAQVNQDQVRFTLVHAQLRGQGFANIADRSEAGHDKRHG